METLLVIGLPETGKTTFLAALWHVAGSEEVPASLRLRRLSDDSRYLNSIKNDWHLCQPSTRSIMVSERSGKLWLHDPGREDIGEVVFPDLAGEEFRDQWKIRQWSTDYHNLAQTARQLLLFVHPEKVVEPLTVAEVQQLAATAFNGVLGHGDRLELSAQEILDDGESALASSANEWDPEHAPTQVQLVGLLQFLEPFLVSKQPIRIAVIISAWDQVPKVDGLPTPQAWIEARLPYLDQYLRSNCELFTVRVYGVSAQGGSFKGDTSQLAAVQPASRRIIIEGPNCSPNDITEPIRWALGWRREDP